MPTQRARPRRDSLRLVGAHELRALLGAGVGRDQAYRITRRSDFPAPVAHLQRGRVWLARDVERWLRERGP
jgi:predicted DNA-binding transcriptional regulator AlpA